MDQKIEIFYDLPRNSDSIEVKISFHKKSDPGFSYYPNYLSGAAGIGIFSGSNRKIIWDIRKEPDYIFTGSGFYFLISAEKIPEKKDQLPENP